jgi:hypothetical protein
MVRVGQSPSFVLGAGSTACNALLTYQLAGPGYLPVGGAKHAGDAKVFSRDLSLRG